MSKCNYLPGLHVNLAVMSVHWALLVSSGSVYEAPVPGSTTPHRCVIVLHVSDEREMLIEAESVVEDPVVTPCCLSVFGLTVAKTSSRWKEMII